MKTIIKFFLILSSLEFLSCNEQDYVYNGLNAVSIKNAQESLLYPTMSTNSVNAFTPTKYYNLLKNVNLTLPTNSIQLSFYDENNTSESETTNLSFVWSKEAGPESYFIQDKTSAVAKLSALTKGTYLFRLTIYESKTDVGRNLITEAGINRFYVIVNPEVGTVRREVIFKNFAWNCPMGCVLSLHLSDYSFTNVFIKKNDSNDWIEISTNYLDNDNSYSLYNNLM